MAHDHHHDPGTYYVEQLCTIGICGVLGAIMILLYQGQKVLDLMVTRRFHPFVLAGGIALLVLCAIRALAVWKTAGHVTPAAHEHDFDPVEDNGNGGPAEPAHVHGPDCDHDHDHPHSHSHADDHGHSHGAGGHAWSPWRYVVLLLPVLLFFLNLPNTGFALVGSRAVTMADVGSATAVDDKGVDFKVGFLELERAAATPESRELYAGKTVRLVGQYVPGPNNRSFGLVRYRMACCAADAVPLSALIMLDPDSKEALPSGLQNKWVQVTGQVQFRERRDGRGGFTTVVLLRPSEDRPLKDYVEVIDQPDTYFLY